MRTKLVLGNWKMNGDVASSEALLAAVRDGVPSGARAGVCPPYPYLGLAAARLSGSAVSWGAQDVAAFDDGAYTGEVSARMLADLGCTWALVGHSERRTLFGDTDDQVARKTARAVAAGLVPVVCVGETLAEREAGRTLEVVGTQLQAGLAGVPAAKADQVVIAYEPVWAIGTGKTATPAMAQEVHAFIRARLGQLLGLETASRVRILYGGSMKPDNADALLAEADIDGGLIGGASLEAKSFTDLVLSAARSATA